MASETRKMATVREVAAIEPIENADRIEVCVIDGWRVVTKRGEFKPGDLVVYLEIDTFCPTTVEPLAFLAERSTRLMGFDGVEVRGHVLKTVKLRGCVSQGLVISPQEFGISQEDARKLCDDEEDISSRIGVCEYVRPVRSSRSPRFIKNPYDSVVAPVTDAARIQNLTKIWDALKKVEAYCTIKVDGRSTTLVFDPHYDKLRLFSHHRELDYEYQVEDGRKTIAQVSYEAAKRQGIVDFCLEHPGITVQFELTGQGIQRSVTGEYVCHVFAVWDMKTRHKYDFSELYENGFDTILDNHVKVLPWYPGQFDTPQDLLDEVDKLYGNVEGGNPTAKDEGVVFHIDGQGIATDDEWHAIVHRLPSTLEFKAVSNKYLLKAKD